MLFSFRIRLLLLQPLRPHFALLYHAGTRLYLALSNCKALSFYLYKKNCFYSTTTSEEVSNLNAIQHKEENPYFSFVGPLLLREIIEILSSGYFCLTDYNRRHSSLQNRIIFEFFQVPFS